MRDKPDTIQKQRYTNTRKMNFILRKSAKKKDNKRVGVFYRRRNQDDFPHLIF